MVANYLRQNGHIIITRNYRSRFGEIDIIAECGEYIIFIEVKTRGSGFIVSGAEAVGGKKQLRLRLTAMDYLRKSCRELEPRFDVAEVTVTKRADGSDSYRLNYLKNAF